MRIATSTMFEAGTTQMSNLQSKLARTQQQLATEKRMLTAADDPIAAARALEVTQSKAVNTQFVANRQNARQSLSEVELSLTRATSIVQDVQELAVKANNGILTDADRKSMVKELEGHLDDMLGVANARDGAGSYLFAGFRTTTAPFAKTAGGADYLGDQGQRQLQVASSRQIPASASGSEVFEKNRTGNGTFVTGANAANSGTGVISSGTVSNKAALANTSYEVNFAVSGTPATTTYSVVDKKTGLPPPDLVGPQPFVPDQQIAFGGVSFHIKGDPAAGDKFSLDPSSNQSVFKTMTDMLATLRAPTSTPADLAKLSNGLSKASENMNAALDNVLAVRSTVGSHQKELDTLDSAGEDLNIQYETTLSNLQDLDMVAAITQFTQQQMSLEAAQKSFKSLSGLSLFNYIG